MHSLCADRYRVVGALLLALHLRCNHALLMTPCTHHTQTRSLARYSIIGSLWPSLQSSEDRSNHLESYSIRPTPSSMHRTRVTHGPSLLSECEGRPSAKWPTIALAAPILHAHPLPSVAPALRLQCSPSRSYTVLRSLHIACSVYSCMARDQSNAHVSLTRPV
jgi:hypothetical protein